MENSNFSSIKDFVNTLINKEGVGGQTIHNLLAIQKEIERLEKENPSIEDQLAQGFEKAASTIKDSYKEIHSVMEKTVSDLFKATKPN